MSLFPFFTRSRKESGLLHKIQTIRLQALLRILADSLNDLDIDDYARIEKSLRAKRKEDDSHLAKDRGKECSRFGSLCSFPFLVKDLPAGHFHSLHPNPFAASPVSAENLHPGRGYFHSFGQYLPTQPIGLPLRWCRGDPDPKPFIPVSQDFITRGSGLNPKVQDLLGDPVVFFLHGSSAGVDSALSSSVDSNSLQCISTVARKEASNSAR
jgi:hypothetical protein